MTAACTKEISSIEPNNKNTIDVSIEGIINGYSEQEDTKASAQNVVRIMWAGGEKVYAYEGIKYLGELTASIDGTDGTYAKLSGTITTPATGKTVTLVYSPQFASNPAVTEGRISVDLAAQGQTEVPFLIYGILSATSFSTISNAVVKFSLATSVYKCNCTGLSKGTLKGASVGAVNTKCELSLSDDSAPMVGGSTPGKIRRTAGFTTSDADQRAIFSVALAKTDATDSRTIEITKGEKRQTAAFAKTAFAPSKAYNAVFAFELLPEGALPGKFTVDVNGKTVHFSKGNLYCSGASFNADGSVKSMEGVKYDFEDPQFNTPSSSKRNSDHISHFMWCSSTDRAIALKYNSDWSFGAPFFATRGFTVNEFSGWSTLTSDEWTYLLNTREQPNRFAKSKFRNMNGILLFPDGYSLPSGYTTSEGGTGMCKVNVTSEYFPSDNIPNEIWNNMEAEGVVFFPAAGNRDGENGFSNVNGVGTHGYYWAASPYDRDKAYGLSFSNVEFTEKYLNRSDACSIRLVTESK